MNIFGEWVYWLQFTGIAIVVVVLLLLAIRWLGWDRVKGWIPAVLGGLAVFGLRAKIQQDAYKDRVAEEEKALDKAEDIVDEKRDEIQTLPDDELDDRLNRWEKP